MEWKREESFFCGHQQKQKYRFHRNSDASSLNGTSRTSADRISTFPLQKMFVRLCHRRTSVLFHDHQMSGKLYHPLTTCDVIWWIVYINRFIWMRRQLFTSHDSKSLMVHNPNLIQQNHLRAWLLIWWIWIFRTFDREHGDWRQSMCTILLFRSERIVLKVTSFAAECYLNLCSAHEKKVPKSEWHSAGHIREQDHSSWKLLHNDR